MMSSKKVFNVQAKQQRNSITSNGSNGSRRSRTLPQLSNLGTNLDSRQTAYYHNDEFDEDDAEGNNDSQRMKTMFMSMWNNVKYGFATKLKTNFSYDNPIWLLGQCYHKKLDALNSKNEHDSKVTAMDKFRHDFHSRIWFTYRKDFPKLIGSHLTTDCGWGCMLRSGQMMLAQAFLFHYLGRQWRWNGPQTDKADMIHRMIVRWFADEPSHMSSPFSVHQLVSFGEFLGKKPGDWYGPASVAHLMRNALVSASKNNPLLTNICCYVAQDCTIYIQDVIDLCCSTTSITNQNSSENKVFSPNEKGFQKERNSFKGQSFDNGSSGSSSFIKNNKSSVIPATSSFTSSNSFNYGKAPSTFNLTDINFSTHNTSSPCSLQYSNEDLSDKLDSNQSKWRGVILFVPVRLGGEKLNPIYINCVKQLLSHSFCLGIIGGKPKHSLYFVGWQDDKLIFIDPHYCQQAVDVKQSNFPLDSFHNNYPRKMPFTNMDPSCCIGFYCQNRAEFFDFVNTVKELIVPPNQGAEYPMFVFNDGKGSCNEFNSELDSKNNKDRVLRVKHRYVNSQGQIEKEVHSDEFIVL